MKKLLVLDKKNYTDKMPVYEKFSVRAVIVKDGKLATQLGSDGDYKILGGGIEAGEDYKTAIIREVKEEAGLVVKANSIVEIGEIEEKREDLYKKNIKYVCHSYFYFCDITNDRVETHMTESEIRKGYHLSWALPEEIIEGNKKFLNQPWIYRDTEFVKMYKNHEFDGVYALSNETSIM